MLIDLTRRPIRLILEECPEAIVVRTQRVAGAADGMIHQEVLSDTQIRTLRRVEVLTPNESTIVHGVEFVETLLRPVSLPEAPLYRWREIQNRNNKEPYYAITAYQDFTTKQTGIWRINLLIEPGTKDKRLLTLFDETHGGVLFTVQIGQLDNSAKVVTPLARLRKKSNEGVISVFNELLEDED